MAANNYHVKLVKGDRQFEAAGDKKFVLDLLRRHWEASTGSQKQLGQADQSGSRPDKEETGSKPVSAGEFIRQLGVKRHMERVLAFGYYLEKFQDQGAFTVGDINNLYYEAKLESSNTSQMIIANCHAGHMMEAKNEKGGRRKYRLTQSGEHKIEKILSNEEVSRSA